MTPKSSTRRKFVIGTAVGGASLLIGALGTPFGRKAYEALFESKQTDTGQDLGEKTAKYTLEIKQSPAYGFSDIPTSISGTAEEIRERYRKTLLGLDPGFNRIGNHLGVLVNSLNKDNPLEKFSLDPQSSFLLEDIQKKGDTAILRYDLNGVPVNGNLYDVSLDIKVGLETYAGRKYIVITNLAGYRIKESHGRFNHPIFAIVGDGLSEKWTAQQLERYGYHKDMVYERIMQDTGKREVMNEIDITGIRRLLLNTIRNHRIPQNQNFVRN